MEEKSITENQSAAEQIKKKPRGKKPVEAEKPAETESSIEAEKPVETAPADTLEETPAPPAETLTKISAESSAEDCLPDMGKFKSVDALMRAYRELEAEFTRRSQKLKALEESAPQSGNAEEKCVPRDEELYREVTENEGVRARVLSDYLSSLKGVPLMTGGGTNVRAPADRPKSIREAGSLALGYLRNQNK